MGCNNPDNIQDFEVYGALTPDLSSGILVNTRGNVNLNVIDTLLVIQTSEEPLFQVYRTSDHKLLNEFGRNGRGPNEFLHPVMIEELYENEQQSQSRLVVHDFEKNIVCSIHVEEVLKDDPRFTCIPLETGRFYLTFLHYVDDRYLVGTPDLGGNLLIRNNKSNEQVVIPYLPKPNFDVPVEHLSGIYRPAVAVNRDKKLIAAAPAHFGEINFFNFSGQLVNEAIFEDRNTFKSEIESGDLYLESPVKYQIIDLSLMGDKILALNWNQPLSKTSEISRPVRLQIFDWSGRALAEYTLGDLKLETSIAYDSIHQRVYAYHSEGKEVNIVFYQLD